MESSPEDRHIYQFEFHGRTGEYFGIWIVNLLLSIVTLGIYSAWAKVRTNRYFYGNTLVAGSAFEYTAEPQKILVGRVIAVSMLIGYQLCILFLPALAGAVLILLLLAIPVIYMASLAFRMRYSQWRGISFNFERDLRGAYLLLLPLVVVVLLMLLGPYFFDLSFEDLVQIENPTQEQLETAQANLSDAQRALVGYTIYTLVVALIAAVLFPLWQRFYYGFIGNRVDFGRTRFNIELPVRKFYRIYLGVLGLLVLALIGVSILMAVMGELFFADQTEGDVGQLTLGLVLATYGLFLIPYVLVFAYLRARLTNLLYSNIQLDDVKFKSTLRFGRILSLYITNALVIIATLGLAIPWARIRVARYRAERMTMMADNLDGFVARSRSDVDASAEAMSDLFDFDIGI